MGEDWVVDSLLGFLQSPTWRYPVDNFIDQNCTGKPMSVMIIAHSLTLLLALVVNNIIVVLLNITAVFDTEDENKFSYTDIHNSYSEMVKSIRRD